MIRYRDSGADDQACPGAWFDANVCPRIRAFRGQYGFFRAGALSKFIPTLRRMVLDGGRLRLVLGSNATDPLTVADLGPLLPLVPPASDGRLTVVSYGNALFHPKVAHIVGDTGRPVGLVGSANMTVQALGTHVEAWLELQADDGPATQVLGDISASIDRWADVDEQGVFQVRTEEDIERLLAQRIVRDRPLPRARQEAPELGGDQPTLRGSRRIRWRPPVLPQVPEAELDVGASGAAEAAPEAPPIAAPFGLAAHARVTIFAMVLAQFDVSHRTGVPGTPEMSLPGEAEAFFGPLGFDSKNQRHAGRHFLVGIETPTGTVIEEYRAWRREAGQGGNADLRFRVSHTLVDMTNPAGGDILQVRRRPGMKPEYDVRLVRTGSPGYQALEARCQRTGGTGGSAGQKRFGLW